jgi:hypothetical protein
MRRLRVLLGSMVIVAGLIPVFAAPVSAACATENVVLYENASSDPNGIGRGLQRCVEEPNLDAVPHNFSGMCPSQFFRFNDNWNDCVSSYRVTLPANRCVRFYEHARGGGAVLATVGGARNAQLINFGAGQNDRLTSLRFFTKVNGVCPAD